jgi:hypothetical protein
MISSFDLAGRAADERAGQSLQMLRSSPEAVETINQEREHNACSLLIAGSEEAQLVTTPWMFLNCLKLPCDSQPVRQS